MQTDFLKRLIIVGTLAFVWAGADAHSVRAQRTDADLTARLLSGAKCASSGSYGSELKGDHVENISVGRQLYTSIFSLQTYGGGKFVMLTCNIDTQRFSTLKLKLGVSDGETWLDPAFTINIYQAGNKILTYKNITRGRMVEPTINLDKSGNIALEVICERSTNNNRAPVYVFDAQLLPNPKRSVLEKVPDALQTSQLSLLESQQPSMSVPANQ